MHQYHQFIISSSSKISSKINKNQGSRLHKDDVTWNQIQRIQFQIHTTSMIHSYLRWLWIEMIEMIETIKRNARINMIKP